jgi:hypothetical protein
MEAINAYVEYAEERTPKKVGQIYADASPIIDVMSDGSFRDHPKPERLPPVNELETQFHYEVTYKTWTPAVKFYVWAHGRMEASIKAIHELHARFPEFKMVVRICTRNAIIIEGRDCTEEILLLAIVTQSPVDNI